MLVWTSRKTTLSLVARYHLELGFRIKHVFKTSENESTLLRFIDCNDTYKDGHWTQVDSFCCVWYHCSTMGSFGKNIEVQSAHFTADEQQEITVSLGSKSSSALSQNSIEAAFNHAYIGCALSRVSTWKQSRLCTIYVFRPINCYVLTSLFHNVGIIERDMQRNTFGLRAVHRATRAKTITA